MQRSLVAVAVIGVVGGVVFLAMADIGPTEEESRALAQREAEACRRVFPETPPQPAWRPCGNGDLCFHCGDARGVLQPVKAPHRQCAAGTGRTIECR